MDESLPKEIIGDAVYGAADPADDLRVVPDAGGEVPDMENRHQQPNHCELERNQSLVSNQRKIPAVCRKETTRGVMTCSYQNTWATAAVTDDCEVASDTQKGGFNITEVQTGFSAVLAWL